MNMTFLSKRIPESELRSLTAILKDKLREIEMNIAPRLRPTSQKIFGLFLLAAMLVIAACQPIVDPALLEDQPEANASPEVTFEVEPARATIDADSLRVREGPSDDYELIAGVKAGESYDVLAMTSDGAWIQLAVERAPDGQGWVSTEFVTLEGDITNIATVPAEGTEADAAASASDEPESTDSTDVAEETNADGESDAVAEAESDAVADAEEEDETETSAAGEGIAVGEALIQTPLPLRVRSEPDDTVDNKIGSVYNLERFPVLDISEDGQWVLIDVPEMSDSGGWIWWENVVISGDIADEFAALTGAEAAEAEDVAEAEEPVTEDAEEAVADDESAAVETELPEELADAVMALIETPLPLRVRSEPTTEVDNKIGNVFDGESYPVLEVSEDGLWIRIYVPELSDDGGWVSAEYAILEEQ
jgi:uncharacterized protein YgiM (DUF1202 family)